MTKIEYYKDKKKEWRWRVVARNGNILADSGEGYKNKSGAVKGSKATKKALNFLLV